jgi:hypothetical protein
MNEQNIEECLLYLVAAKEVEPLLVDWLIDSELIKGFSSVAISGHGSDNLALSVAEQVEGRRWQVLYLIRMPKTDLDTVLQALKHDLAHIGIEYWAIPVITHGKIT